METLSREKVKAKKEHYCDYCSCIISKGETYNRSAHKHEGDLFTWKSHQKCVDIAETLKMFDECCDGVGGEDFREIVENEYREILIKTNLELYESKEFKYPKFSEILDFVINNHNNLTSIRG